MAEPDHVYMGTVEVTIEQRLANRDFTTLSYKTGYMFLDYPDNSDFEVDVGGLCDMFFDGRPYVNIASPRNNELTPATPAKVMGSLEETPVYMDASLIRQVQGNGKLYKLILELLVGNETVDVARSTVEGALRPLFQKYAPKAESE